MKRIKVIVIFTVLWHLIQGMALKVDISKGEENNYKSLVKKNSTNIQSGISGVSEDLNSGLIGNRYNFELFRFKNHNFFLPTLNLKQPKKKGWSNRKFQIDKTLDLIIKKIILSNHTKLLMKKHIVEDTSIRRPSKYFNTRTTIWKENFNWKNKIRENSFNNLIHVVSKRSALNNTGKNNNISQLQLKNNKVGINESRTEEEHDYPNLENTTNNDFEKKGSVRITPEKLLKDIEKKQNEFILTKVITDGIQESTYESLFMQKETVNNSETLKMNPGKYSSTESTRNTFIEKPMTYSNKSLFSLKTKDVSQEKNKYENFNINKNDQQIMFKKGRDDYSVTQQPDILRVQVYWKTVSDVIPVRTTTEAINYGMIISVPNRSCPPGYRRYQHKCRLVF